MHSEIPDFVVHYHQADRRPFANLSDLEGTELADVVSDLMHRRSAGEHHRVFGARYMELRRQTEGKMRRLFIEAGGRPERVAPHYFILGHSQWFRGLAESMREVVVPRSVLPSEVTSFTYPDSFTAMGLAARFGLPYEARPYHERVFRMEALTEVIGRYGLPRTDDFGYDGYQQRPFEVYVEVQLWSDAPVAHLLHPERPRADGVP